MSVNLRKRIADYGEFFTAQREGNAMLALVKQEADCIGCVFWSMSIAVKNVILAFCIRRREKTCISKVNMPI